jgi:serine/threonine protein kinase
MSDSTSHLERAPANAAPSVSAPEETTTQIEPAVTGGPEPISAPSPEREDKTATPRTTPEEASGSTLSDKDTSADEEIAAPFSVRRFGDYELLAEIARGGMGIVYRARQLSLDRVVALKMILGGRLAQADDVTRFRTEAAAAANLSHPNIVAVYEIGAIEGQHFFSMKLIEGQSLAHRLRDGPLPGRTAARYVAQVARALHHAHRHGILHRDVKPSNIMIDADDQPHITDFGLAKRIGDSGQTRTGAVLGTPSYMAPEQASGRIHDLGPGCDVYGLGAVLYEAVTGRPPFRSESPMDTLVKVVDNEPVPPTLLNPKVDRDLETICLKCLEKDPKRRYPSAEALAQDLEHYVNGEEISARSFNVLDRLARTLGRSHHAPAFATWSTMIMVIAVIVLVGHSLVFLLYQTGQSATVIFWMKVAQFTAIGYVFWLNRGSRILPTTPAERLLWTIWIGYVTAWFVSLGAMRSLLQLQIIVPNPEGPHLAGDLALYPFAAVISGLAFFIMGSNYWGRLYAFGTGFFLLAVSMPLYIEWAPLVFGVWWAITLAATAFHLRSLGLELEAEKRI